MREKTTVKVLIDNARTRVTEHRFAPGATTGRHRHDRDYLVVPVVDGRLRVITPDGTEKISELKAGQQAFRAAGGEHEVVNDSDSEYAYIEVELK